MAQDEVDARLRPGATSEGAQEVKRPKAGNKRSHEVNEILRKASAFFVREARPPQRLIAGFIDRMRAEGHTVRVMRSNRSVRPCASRAVQNAARTYRCWKQPGRRSASNRWEPPLNTFHII